MIKAVLPIIAVLFASAAFAQDNQGATSTSAQSAPAPAQTAPAADPEADRIRCRSIYQLNSRIPERVCRTRAEWDRIELDSREAMDRNRRGAGASGNGG